MSDRQGPNSQRPFGEAPLSPVRTSGPALASLVCGIVSFVTLGLGGLVALTPRRWAADLSDELGSLGRALWGLGWLTGMVLGVWAIVRITGNPLKRKGRGLAVAGICVSVASLLTFLAIELSIDVGVDSKGRVPSVACRSHLRNVGLGVLMYADDNQDVLPESLTDLVDQGYVTPEPLICPSDTSPMWIGYQCSFDYLGELSISEVEMVADIGRLIVAYESKANPSMAETPCASTATSSNWRNPPSESG